MDEARSLTVGAVARIASITVRTLHHYDEIGLLRPSVRTDAGYRRYTNADLERLQQILFYRELGFALDEIESMMKRGGVTPVAHLRRQHTLLLERIARLKRMASAVEKAMEAQQMGIQLTATERLEVFGDFNPDAYTDEVQERWGQTDAYHESARRAARYTADDWKRMKAESAAVTQQAVAAMQAGLPADSVEAMDAAEAHRQQISRWFYDCSYEIHTGLAEMYIADPRFTAIYENIAPGLAQYFHDAILANAARASG